MAFPAESRTTTGTITRFTLVLNVAGASRVDISGPFGAGALVAADVFCTGGAGAWPRATSPDRTPSSRAATAPFKCIGELNSSTAGQFYCIFPSNAPNAALIEARQQFQVFFGHRLQRIAGPPPGS